MNLTYRGVEITKTQSGTFTCTLDGREKTASDYKRLCDQIRSHQWHAKRRSTLINEGVSR